MKSPSQLVDSKGNAFRNIEIRRSPFLVMYFQGLDLVFENYITRESFRSDRDTCELLAYFTTWKTLSQAASAFRGFTRESILRSAENLLSHGLLITRGSVQDKLESKFRETWLWPLSSRYYHFSTKLGEPYATTQEVREYYEKYLKDKKQPPIYKTYERSPKTRLSVPDGTEAPLFATLRIRHSTRQFSGQPISLEQLSRIVYYTWGRVSTYKTREFGELLHKTSPSAGARHPIEAYLVVNRVDGLDAGIYHYSVKDHSLELLKPGDFREKCVAFSAGQSWTRDASVLFILTAVVSRTTWKYRIPRSYRAFLLDAGHLSQSFLTVATALGLGAFCIGTISDLTIEEELGLDGVTETVIFVLGVGQSAKTRARSGPKPDQPVSGLQC